MMWEVMERLAWLATAVAFLWLLHLVSVWWKGISTVYPDYCPNMWVRDGKEECGGPCSMHRPLMCQARARKRT
jgi:hypothetical protein